MNRVCCPVRKQTTIPLRLCAQYKYPRLYAILYDRSTCSCPLLFVFAHPSLVVVPCFDRFAGWRLHERRRVAPWARRHGELAYCCTWNCCAIIFRPQISIDMVVIIFHGFVNVELIFRHRQDAARDASYCKYAVDASYCTASTISTTNPHHADVAPDWAGHSQPTSLPIHLLLELAPKVEIE